MEPYYNEIYRGSFGESCELPAIETYESSLGLLFSITISNLLVELDLLFCLEANCNHLSLYNTLCHFPPISIDPDGLGLNTGQFREVAGECLLEVLYIVFERSTSLQQLYP